MKITKKEIKTIYQYIFDRHFSEKCSSASTQQIYAYFHNLFDPDEINYILNVLKNNKKIRQNAELKWIPMPEIQNIKNIVSKRVAKVLNEKLVRNAIDYYYTHTKKNPDIYELMESFYDLYGDFDEVKLKNYIRNIAKEGLIEKTKDFKYKVK